MDDFDANVWGDAPSSPPQAPVVPRAPQPRALSSTVPLDFSNFNGDDDDDEDEDAFGSGFDDVPQTQTTITTTTAEGGADGDDDDDFGDFGDFGDATVAEPFDDDGQDGFGDDAFQDTAQQQLPPEPGPSNWTPLKLHPMPSRAQLIEDVERLLEPVFGHVDPSTVMSPDPIRQVDGLGQTLVTPSRYVLISFKTRD